ncbi:MAG: iron-containing alcohol dehydrogenase [Bacteroidales bacterium]|jgi:alcohol dehydrogenase class IV|nr:iron-containing alcohol dehydrogenase [Bacteroidales bacterium]
MFKLYCRIYQFLFRCASFLLPWRFPKILSNFDSLVEVLTQKNVKTALLVTDVGIVKAELHLELLNKLHTNGIRCIMYDKTLQNPTIENTEEALVLYKMEDCTAIIALGGGSPLDCAKGVGARVARPRKTIPKMRGTLKVLKRIPLFVAIPTTSGTGSENTLAAVITNSVTHEKYAITDPSLFPHYALMNPALTIGLPPLLTAYTGMDALSHAVEAYIGQCNTCQTRKDALKATQLIFENLFVAFSDGQNIAARKNMQDASFLAGKAFTRAYVGNIHAVAHTLGGEYGTQHGLANAAIMPHILDMYGKHIHKRLSEMAVAAGLANKTATNEENAEKFIAAIREMNAKMGIPDKISDLKKEDVPKLAKRALKEANPLYPVPIIFKLKEMKKVYYKILKEV